MSELATRPLRLTLFEDRAEVVRRAEGTVAAGVTWVTLGGATPFVDDRSLRARAEGASVLAARVRRRLADDATLAPEALHALEADERRARAAVQSADFALERAEAERRRAAQLLADFVSALAQVPRHAAEPERAEEWRAAWRALDEASAGATRAKEAARAAKEQAHDAHSRAIARLGEGRRRERRHQALVEVQLEAAAAGPLALEITYLTPCALWRPEHQVRLSGGTLEIVTSACAWQGTGEDWHDVEARFSTARTARAASAPLLSDDVLRPREKPPEERKRVVVQARDQSIAVTGEGGARAASEMPGVDDGGEPLTFTAPARVSLASDGRPFRVELRRVTLTPEVSRVLMAERALSAHLRARATLPSGPPLLAGPLVLVRDHTYVGRGQTNLVAAGEPLAVGLGTDDAVRVRRELDEERDTAALTGTQKRKREVRLYLSNLSGEKRTVEVQERIPVSEIEGLEVICNDAGWKIDGDGIGRRTVELAPGAHEKLTLRYELRASSNLVLP